ncbi:UNVERIFIED_CONTAM: putative cyclic nucleotide-gated ion channel 20, chloroplastic [Sesamum calycinum]|uniref:Cyclic nucleotide-gated ion channel 20, chloroplastic n=1 Tax=Sesamum calycinum TaxID=2727403 RepID=A0AAW2PP29_9LAMI
MLYVMGFQKLTMEISRKCIWGMDASERDEIPMLSAAYFQEDDRNDSTSRSFSTRTRSASMSIPMTSLDSSGNEHNLVGFTGPLRNERRSTTFVQMSGPLYVNRNNEFVFQGPEGALRKKTPESKIERYPSIDRVENNDWPSSDYAGKNEHLLKSGQLGMCNDAYCTTCPTYYNVKGRQKHSRTSEIFDAKSVNRCFRDACRNSNITRCMDFIDCGHGNDYGDFENDPAWELWKTNENATACFWKDGFDFGIYENAVNLTTHKSLVTKYVYSFFWGFQQISTLAGNQVPSYFVWEVLFTMAIIGIGLLLFALLIGNMQNFLQALGRRRLEMSLRRRDVEQWMSHRRLPEQLRRQVRDSERFNWAATRGVNEEMLMENLPEDLQRYKASSL